MKKNDDKIIRLKSDHIGIETQDKIALEFKNTVFEIRPYWNRDLFQFAVKMNSTLFEIRPYWNRDRKDCVW